MEKRKVPKILTGYIVYFSGSWNYYWLAETAEGVAFFPTDKEDNNKPFFNRIEGVRTMIETGSIVLSGHVNHLDASRERQDAKES